jgi:glycosyltransferase involved in cell wall biosynthesis
MQTCSNDISIVTPTFRRPAEVVGLLQNLAQQSLLPREVILVDGAPSEERETEAAVERAITSFPFTIRYVRHEGGTAIQRNAGIELAGSGLIALIDDDVRLDRQFLQVIADALKLDESKGIGGIVGYRTNEHFSIDESERWRWYRRLGLLKLYEPGRYDYETGYPINNSMQPPFSGLRHVDFMTTACAVWRREVFDSGLRFDEFFRDFGVLEDAHFSLRAGRKWKLMQCGDAHCEELRSPNGRIDRYSLGYKCVVNYYKVYRDVASPLSFTRKFRFWRFQAFEVFRIFMSALRRRNWSDVQDAIGRIRGVYSVISGSSKA